MLEGRKERPNPLRFKHLELLRKHSIIIFIALFLSPSVSHVSKLSILKMSFLESSLISSRGSSRKNSNFKVFDVKGFFDKDVRLFWTAVVVCVKIF